MRYIIHNKNLLENKDQQTFFEEEVQNKLKLLEPVLVNYSKEPVPEIFINKISDHDYRIDVSLPLKDKPLFLEEKGSKPVAVVNNLLDKLRYQVKKRLQKERREHLYKRKTRQAETIGQYLNNLVKEKEKADKKAFIQQLQKSIPHLQNYLHRRLRVTHAISIIKKKQVSLQELTDELYLRIYEKFWVRPAQNELFLPWVYRLADDLIEEMLDEAEFHKLYIEQLERLEEQEYRLMKEEFSADAEGELLMLEEFDDPSYRDYQYHLTDVVSENSEDELLDRIEASLEEEEIKQKIGKALTGSPFLKKPFSICIPANK